MLWQKEKERGDTMILIRKGWLVRSLALVYAAVLLAAAGFASAAKGPVCTKVTVAGEVQAGQEWKQAFGQGWFFRLVPIQAGNAGYSGWDLAVDREPGVGFPDALLLATPPYDSISEREMGTTFGLRAQDAIGWNPRSFRFLTDAAALQKGQKLYVELHGASEAKARAGKGLMDLMKQASAGQLQVLNSRIVPGTGDAAPFAKRWAMQSSKTQHTDEPGQASGKMSVQVPARGELRWMQFRITLWLPAGWKAAKGVEAVRTGCSE